MDFAGIIKFISIVGLSLSIVLIPSLLVGYAYHEEITLFAVYNISFFLINLIMFLLVRNKEINFGIKESIVSVNLVWILLGIATAIPLYFGSDIEFNEAFFEAISGFTTTGASIYTDIDDLPRHILLIRSTTNWFGGMGIIVLSVGLLSAINPTGTMSLFKAESTGIQTEKLTPKMKHTAMRLWIAYSLLTFFNFIFLHSFGMGWFDALNHAFTTISTGGFSTKTSSLGYFAGNDPIIWITTLFMILSGISFVAHLKLLSGNTSGYKSEEVKWYLIIIFVFSTILALIHILDNNHGIYESIKHASFTIASIVTTTGFSSTDYESWGFIAVAIIFFAMLVGGCAGSTSGGMKVIRYVVLFKSVSAEFKQILHPNAITPVMVDHNPIKDKVLRLTFGFFFLFVFTGLLTTLYLYARGFDALTSLSTTISMIGNIGPGFGDVGPSGTFVNFSWYDKYILSFVMIIGRLEIYTTILLFTRSLWKNF